MHTLIDLDGVTVARAQVTADGITLQLFAPSGFSEGGTFYPAESVTISRFEAAVALHTLLSELIEAYGELRS